MKKFALFLVVTLCLGLLSGCRISVGQTTTASNTTVPATSTQPTTAAPTTVAPTNPGTVGSSAAQLLGAIWDTYAQEERFAAYGGTVEQSVSDAPGDLNMTSTEELTGSYLIPEDLLGDVEAAASLVHMMNSNIFTAAVLKLKSTGQPRAFADQWRGVIRENRWICGQPDRLLMMAIDEEHLLMAFGSSDAMDTFRSKANAVYGQSRTLFDEPIVA